VLLKDEEYILPFKIQKTLVIGLNAIYAACSGVGSTLSKPYYSVYPSELIKVKIGNGNGHYELELYNHKYSPCLKNELFHGDKNGTLMEIYNESISVIDREPLSFLSSKIVIS
jgi:beta-glucosidase